MSGSAQNHAVIRDDARRYGVRLAERTIEKYGLDIADEEVNDAVAEVMREIRQRVGCLSKEGLPRELAIIWGHEAINGLQDRLLEHISYLRMTARLVGCDPAKVTEQ